MNQAVISAIHLDAVGGVAGDMFVAALLDVRPELWPGCQAALAALELPPGVEASPAPHSDGTLGGSRFVVTDTDTGHSHTHWHQIRSRLQEAALTDDVRDAALGIFQALAEAEAAVHAIAVDEVAFHEVGAVDSIVDVVCAAAIIAAIGPCRWSVGPLPRGRGQVRTAHGVLPLPAPATLKLLEGFLLFDDGEEGERITPTGAAILRHLEVAQDIDGKVRRLVGTGTGFGTRTFESRSNVLRATLYAAAEGDLASDHVEVLRCEIDDQSAEDLAVALDHLRRSAGVIDVCQWPVFAKKGRIATALQVLTQPEAADRVIAEILDETTTLGVRREARARCTLERRSGRSHEIGIKLARRPGGLTAKAEMDDLAAIEGAAARRATRREAEAKALLAEDGNGDDDAA
ncbi:MAG: LarC family nickel insertion protein [Alphaproteobacteria bacterium]|jgi:hypothetical protein|nr:hypothetical protein [Rhodospirillaceae bacterium]MDP6404810.1 LarC family nickel insertion protein [Alphaproteobacteria bacterium]MDP6624817.1 LarC family nickel insertion protein [Alphaproteobacteria bacterium]|tara:strand:+ start:139 stop:1347 length:1209 start_codon:yes stop_codon:yes gene_type:complete